MRVSGLIVVSLAIASIAISVEAKSLRSVRGPAETPPSSFAGLQYVDSKGCAFIRAGYAGKVTWVPRVERNRQIICGQKPSLVATAGNAIVADSGPAKIATLVSGSQPVRPKNGFSWFQSRPRKKVMTANPVLIRQVAPSLAPNTTIARPVPVLLATSKPGRKLWRVAIRRGPQANHPGDLFNGRLGRGGVPTAQVTRTNPVLSAPVLPAGYKTLLSENFVAGRRGFGTPGGQAAMDLLWTRTMPRRLIDVTTGRDMTTQLPQIIYPYVTVSTKSYGAVAANAEGARKRLLRDEASPVNMVKIQDVSATTDQISETKTAAKIATSVVSRFVQVATFGVPANAARTLAKFSAGGFPTNSRPLKRKGKSYDIVLLGPFQDQVKLAQALTQAQKAGFSDAFYVE